MRLSFQVALHEEQSMSLSKEMFKVREELEKTKKEKTKLERAKSTTKLLKGLAETKVVPEEKYCKVEADYDQALQKIAVSCLFTSTPCIPHSPTCFQAARL